MVESKGKEGEPVEKEKAKGNKGRIIRKRG